MDNKDWRRGFYAGALSALTVLFYADPSCDVRYGEVVHAIGLVPLVEEARRSGNMRSSGLSKFLRSEGLRGRRTRVAAKVGGYESGEHDLKD